MPRFKASFNSLTGEHSVRLAGEHFMTMAHRETAHALAGILNEAVALAAEMNEPAGIYQSRDEFNRVKVAYAVCKALGLQGRFDLVKPDGEQGSASEVLDTLAELAEFVGNERDVALAAGTVDGRFDHPDDEAYFKHVDALRARAEKVLAAHGRAVSDKEANEGGRHAIG